MAGQKSGSAPGKTPYAPGGAEVWSDAPNNDYFNDPYFHREASVEQSQQQRQDVRRLSKEKDKLQGYNQGGMVKHGSSTAKRGSDMAKDPNVVPVAAPGAGIDPEWEKFQRENEAGRKENRARKIERFAPIPTPGAGPPGQGYRPYGTDTSTDKFNQGGMVTKHGSSTHVACATKHR